MRCPCASAATAAALLALAPAATAAGDSDATLPPSLRAATAAGSDVTLPPSLRALLPPSTSWVSASGDPGQVAERPAVLVVGWNFCNGALAPPEYPSHPSPRWADCGDGVVTPADNALGPGDPFPSGGWNATTDANAYAIEKELFMGAACTRPAAVPPGAPAWNYSFHTVMLKSGNMNTAAGICPETVAGVGFNNLPMNQPLLELTPAAVRSVPYGGTGYVGSLGATYDVDPSWTPAQAAAVRAALANYTAAWIDYRFAEVDGVTPLPPAPEAAPPALLVNKSYEGVVWWRNVSSGATVFHHVQQSSPAAPWLMSYYKLMDATGVGGGYDWPGAGQMRGPVPSYASRLRVQYNQLTKTNLYVPCHGGCWKLDGSPCDGDLFTDITRYVCFLVNAGPGAGGGCSAKNQGGCPLFHVRAADGKRIFRNNTAEYPYSCYSQHCGPGGGGVGGCDPYSNPGPQGERRRRGGVGRRLATAREGAGALVLANDAAVSRSPFFSLLPHTTRPTPALPPSRRADDAAAVRRVGDPRVPHHARRRGRRPAGPGLWRAGRAGGAGGHRAGGRGARRARRGGLGAAAAAEHPAAVPRLDALVGGRRLWRGAVHARVQPVRVHGGGHARGRRGVRG
jgi:hypothetical protein